MRDSIIPWFDYVSVHRSKGSARTYRHHLSAFFDWLGNRPLTRFLIEDYMTSKVKSNYAKATVNGMLAAIKSFCKWHCPRHGLDDPSTKIMAFKRAETKPKHQRFLTVSEYAKVLLVAEAGVELDMVEFIGNTGLRREEFIDFHTRHFTTDRRHLVVRRGKGNKERRVPVNAKLLEVVARSGREDGSLRCVTYWNGNANRIWDCCQSLARRAGIPGFGPHAIRHYFATILILKGVPIKLVSQVLGHSSVIITEQTYCHLLPEDTTGITDCLC